ncbi:hypothetical protein D9611_012710 [Ephemerocybe angulata]|uniref:Uncharacterized protein n=1 Tax=Ephemerocybe angulata TaxID=980116 RepID=A0A8H5B9J7_9AGAR|nr:hypothetical protein D9611_012710 [Tulosesus angulatus]
MFYCLWTPLTFVPCSGQLPRWHAVQITAMSLPDIASLNLSGSDPVHLKGDDNIFPTLESLKLSNSDPAYVKEVDDAMESISILYTAPGMADWIEYAFGLDRGDLDDGKTKEVTTEVKVCRSLWDRFWDGHWAILPLDSDHTTMIAEFARNTDDECYVPNSDNQAKGEDMSIDRLLYWPHLIQITRADGTPCPAFGETVTSEVHPACAMISVFRFLDMDGSAELDMVEKLGNEPASFLKLKDQLSLIRSQVSKFQKAASILYFPGEFLAKNPRLKRSMPPYMIHEGPGKPPGDTMTVVDALDLNRFLPSQGR